MSEKDWGMLMRPRGVAILMVIAILAGLMALASPFVFSMILHGRSARADLHSLQARAGADAATAVALSQLQKNTLHFDLAKGEPEITTPKDLKIFMEFPLAAKEFDKYGVNPQNPAGLMWSAKVEDEQAKINVNSCPPNLLGNLLGSGLLVQAAPQGTTQLAVDDGRRMSGASSICMNGEASAIPCAVQGNIIFLKRGTAQAHIEGELVYDGRALTICDQKIKLGDSNYIPFRSGYEIKTALVPPEGLLPDEYARIERHITVQSGLDGPLWGRGEARYWPNGVPPGAGQATGAKVSSFFVESDEGFAPGVLVRELVNGEPIDFARVLRSDPVQSGGVTISLSRPIDTSAIAFIQPQIHHPININTASPEVLEAVFTGLCVVKQKDALNHNKAQELAYYLLGNNAVYSSAITLKKALDAAHTKGILTAPERDAVYINATEPGSPKLRTSTVPFCFFSFGSFTIEGSGVVNSDNGVQFARHTTRELVSLPTPWPGRFRVEHQADFEALIDQGLGKRVLTYPTPMGYKKAAQNAIIRLPSFTTGGVRLDIGESGPHNFPGEFMEHCDDDRDPGFRVDGYDMSKRGPFILPPGGNRGRGGGRLNRNNNPTVTMGGQVINPGNNGLAGRGTQTASQPTAVEMWYRPIHPGQCVFYDEGLEEERNRTTFSYEPSAQPKPGLVVKIYDAGMECMDVATNGWTHLKRPPVECIYPVTFDGGEWYHVAASWKSSRMNGQEIRLDAQPEPKGEKLIFKPGAKLAQSLALDEFDTLEVETEDGDLRDLFPRKGGAVQIGEEIIEYQSCNGNTFSQLRRGARLSAQSRHEGGEFVMPYGFSITTQRDLPVGGAFLSERLEKTSGNQPGGWIQTTIDLPPKYPQPFVLDTETAKIPVSDASEFPPSGFLICSSGELIYYGKKTATAFLQLQRGMRSFNFGAPARNLSNRAQLVLASLEITDSSQYDSARDLNDAPIVQIDSDSNDKLVEWIRYGDKQVINGKHYLVARVWQTPGAISYNKGPQNTPTPGPSLSPYGRFREEYGIGVKQAHDKKAKVIPVVKMNGPHCGDQQSPYGEDGVSEVTVVERGTVAGDLRYVKQAYNEMYGSSNGAPCPRTRFAGWTLNYYCGLNDFVSRRFPANQTRFLKWPSGELPDAVGAKRIVGADRNGEGKLSGHVDEIKVNILPSSAARIAMTKDGVGVQSGDTDILLEEHDSWPFDGGGGTTSLNWPTNGGLVRIEEELIYYKALGDGRFQYYSDVFPYLNGKPPEGNKADRRWINPCTGEHELQPNIKNKTGTRIVGVIRGVLGTHAVDHPVGAQAMLLDGMSVSALRGNFASGGDTFTIAQTEARGFPEEGYVWIDNEVVSYTHRQGATFHGCKNFRARFGTMEGDHDAEAIVRCLPFRYWDREGRLYDGDGLAYIQAGYSASDAIWTGIELGVTGTEEIPAPPVHCIPRVLVRFDNQPLWSAEPSPNEGGLYQFKLRNGQAAIRGLHGGVKAEQLEMRVYWQYSRGAFLPGQDWKRTFSLEKMRATYYTPLIMRRLDEVERR